LSNALNGVEARMSSKWHHLGRTPEKRVEAEFRGKGVTFRERMDPVWVGLLVSVLFVLVVGWLVSVVVAQRFGVFDRAPLRAVTDERIIGNILDEVETKPFLASVYHGAENRIYLAQTGGLIHRYDPETGLWTTETPFSETSDVPMLDPEVTYLRSGSGADPLSNVTGISGDRESMWGITAGNGLVRRYDGKWQVVKSDSSFIGVDGTPVGQGRMTAAAVSGDGQWLVVGTRAEGIGIYHIPTHRWIPGTPDVSRQLPSQQVTHIAWGNERFWIGGTRGLASLIIVGEKGTPLITEAEEVTGEVFDMEASPGGGLWVLERRDCRTGGRNCLRLSVYPAGPGEPAPIVLMEEQNIYPNLNLEDLQFAQYWTEEGRLILAGTAGVYSYDTTRHNWERHFRGAVTAAKAFDDGSGFYFGYNGGIGRVSRDGYRPWDQEDKRCSIWLMPGAHRHEKIIALDFQQKNEVMALGLTGKLFAVDTRKAPKNKANIRLIYDGGRSGSTLSPSSFRSAAAFGDVVIFRGEYGSSNVLIHDTVTRSYKDVPLKSLPEWMRREDTRMFASGGQVYGISRTGGDSQVYRVPLADAIEGKFDNALQLGRIPGPIQQIRDWNGGGIAVLTGGADGRIFRFDVQKLSLTGIKAEEMNNRTLIDAAAYENGVMFATRQGLRYYNYHSRSWGRDHIAPRGMTPDEVVQCGGKIFMSTRQGQLMELNRAGQYEDRIGGAGGFNMSDGQISDARLNNEQIYIAGNGRINRYDIDLRSITNRWSLPGSGTVELVDIIRGQPLALCDGTATLGGKVIDAAAGRVVSLSRDKDYIWTVRRKGSDGHKYLTRYPVDDPFTLSPLCFFYNPYSGSDTGRIFDAAALPDDYLAVATGGGLKFYSPAARSWYGHTNPDPIPAGSQNGELFVMNQHLVTVSDQNNRLRLSMMDLGGFHLPGSCTRDAVAVKIKPREIDALAVDPAGNRIAFIDKGQKRAIFEWYGNEIELLSPTGNEPVSGTLRRIYGRKAYQTDYRYLLFIPEEMDKIWRYDLNQRFWRKIPLYPETANSESAAIRQDPIIEIQITQRENEELVTARGRSGIYYRGRRESLIDNAALSGVNLGRLYVPTQGTEIDTAQLQDIQLRGRDGSETEKNTWTFIFADGIRYYDSLRRRWSKKVSIPASGESERFRYTGVNQLGVIESADRRTLWVARDRGPHPESFARFRWTPVEGETAALDDSGNIWRLTTDGTLYRAAPPDEGNYPEPQSAYEEPFYLEPNSVRAVYRWDEWLVMEEDTGIRILDTMLRQELELPDTAELIGEIKEILKEGNRLWIRTQRDRLVLLTHQPNNTVGSRVFGGTVTGLENRIVQMRGEKFGSSPMLKNQWEQLKKNVARLPNGKLAYDPIQRMEVGQANELVLRRPGGSETLAPHGILLGTPLPQLPALDINWLKWNRDSRSITLRTPTSAIDMTPIEFFRDGKMPFEEIDALITDTQNGNYAANRFGIWHYSRDDLGLTDRSLTFLPMKWEKPTGAAHGKFISTSGMYNPDGSTVPRSSQNHVLTFGDVTLTENSRQKTISGHIKLQGSSSYINAFGYKGFNWDKNKRGLAYGARGLLVLSDAGLHPISGYNGFEAEPGETVGSGGTIYSRQKGTIYYRRGQRWFRRNAPSTWTGGVADPRKNRNLLENSTWKWDMVNGRLRIKLKGQSHGFKPEITARGLGFTSDRLQDAAAVNDRLMVMSEAFFEAVSSSGSPGNLQSARYPARRTRQLKVLPGTGTNPELMLQSTDGSNFIWNHVSTQFEPVTSERDPRWNRTLVNIPSGNPRLRFTREPGGQIIKELRLDRIDGGSGWVTIRLTAEHRRFPFDVVTSMAASENELYIGTRAGLQVFSGSIETGLRRFDAFYDMRGSNRGPLAPVTGVGIPASRPDIVAAASSSLCLETSVTSGGTFKRCGKSLDLTHRLRLETGFWRIRQQSGGRGRNPGIDGRYKNERGQYKSRAVKVNDGRLSHDHIKDIAIYKDDVLTLWTDGWVSRHHSLNLEITDQTVNYDIASAGARRFIPIPLDLAYTRKVIPEGLYLEGQNGTVWKYTAEGTPDRHWQVIKDRDLTAGILGYANRPPILLRKQLRLLSPSRNRAAGGVYRFEYRAPDGRWRSLPWIDGRVAVDHWKSFAAHQGNLWAMTPAGLVRFTRSIEGNAVLDPQTFTVITEPKLVGQFQPGTEADIYLYGEEAGNRDHVIVQLKNDKKRTFYRGSLEDTGLSEELKPIDSSDPELKQILAQQDLLVPETANTSWQWSKTRNSDTGREHVEGRLKGETFQMVGGRFGFDMLTSIAFLREDRLEFSTEGTGWHQIPLTSTGELNFNISGWQRPETAGINPSLVKEVRTNIDRDGIPVMGLRIPGDGFTRLKEGKVTGRTEQFYQYRCSDGFWQYMTGAGEDELGLVIEAVTSGRRESEALAAGVAVRRLQEGRFTDDRVLGYPVGGEDQRGLYYLLPTAAGALRMDAAMTPTGIYPLETLTLQQGSAPSVLFIDYRTDPNRSRPLYLGKNGLYPLEQVPGSDSVPLFKPKKHVPPDAVIIGLEEGPQDFIRILWQKDNRQGWTLVNPSTVDYSTSAGSGDNNRDNIRDNNRDNNRDKNLYNILYVNLRDFGAWSTKRENVEGAEAWMRIHFVPEGMEFLQFGAEAPYKMDFPDTTHLLVALVKGERMFVMGKTRLWEVNLEHARKHSKNSKIRRNR
jgi:hypothetical protein